MNDDSTEKRMAGDYEIIQAVQIGDREVVLGENPQDETGMKYMCAFCRQNALFAEYSEVMASDDCEVIFWKSRSTGKSATTPNPCFSG